MHGNRLLAACDDDAVRSNANDGPRQRPADLVLVVLDTTATISTEEVELLNSLDGRPHVIARNKSDLLTTPSQNKQKESDSLQTSALTGEGLSELRAARFRNRRFSFCRIAFAALRLLGMAIAPVIFQFTKSRSLTAVPAPFWEGLD